MIRKVTEVKRRISVSGDQWHVYTLSCGHVLECLAYNVRTHQSSPPQAKKKCRECEKEQAEASQ